MYTHSAELILCVIPLLQLNKTTLYGLYLSTYQIKCRWPKDQFRVYDPIYIGVKSVIELHYCFLKLLFHHKLINPFTKIRKLKNPLGIKYSSIKIKMQLQTYADFTKRYLLSLKVSLTTLEHNPSGRKKISLILPSKVPVTNQNIC